MIEVPTFPMMAYHPIHGAVTVKTPEEAAKTLTVATDWFKTAAEADAHRHAGEAEVVIHNARRGQINRHEEAGVVKHSVTHQDDIDRKMEANKAAAEAQDVPVEVPPDETRGAELTV